jgi:GGDEF domain-containing protein
VVSAGDSDADELITRADRSMYEAKERRRAGALSGPATRARAG